MSPITVTFDAHVPDAFFALSPADRDVLLAAFRGGRYKFIPTMEFLEENLCLVATSRAANLQNHARFVLDTSGSEAFSYWGNIVCTELHGSTQPFVDAQTLTLMRRDLESLAQGERIEGLEALARSSAARKTQDADIYRGHQVRIQADLDRLVVTRRAAGDRITAQRVQSLTARMSYPDYHSRYMRRYGENLIERICTQCGIGATEAPRILASLGDYPFTNTLVNLDTLLLHRYIALRRRVDEGDVYDAHQLLCVQGVDIFVTNERRIHEMFPLIHPTKRCLQVPEFIRELSRVP